MARRLAVVGFVLLVGVMAACSDGDDGDDESGGAAPATTTTRPQATSLVATATEYSFAMPATVKGGLVKVSLVNGGAESHLARVARVAPGRTFDEVKTALAAAQPPPPGGLPYEEWAGVSTIDPGAAGNMTVHLAAGTYAFFCLITAPDGQTHSAKGMINQLTVSEGQPGQLPAATKTVVATDFAFATTPQPELRQGLNTMRLRNEGQQLHEVDLVELTIDQTVDGVAAWYRQPVGPPPMRRLGGAAIRPGEEVSTELELVGGSRYAFVCALPDVRGDLAAHVTKGMFLPRFRAR